MARLPSRITGAPALPSGAAHIVHHPAQSCDSYQSNDTAQQMEACFPPGCPGRCSKQTPFREAHRPLPLVDLVITVDVNLRGHHRLAVARVEERRPPRQLHGDWLRLPPHRRLGWLVLRLQQLLDRLLLTGRCGEVGDRVQTIPNANVLPSSTCQPNCCMFPPTTV